MHRTTASWIESSAAATPGSGARPREVGPAGSHCVVRIAPGGLWTRGALRAVWTYRELLYFLVWRDVKVRYKQAVLGVAWAVLQPLATMLMFTLVFGRLARVPSDGVPYPLFALAGLLPWTFFSNAVTAAGNSVVGNERLIGKIWFPRLLIPAAAVLANLVEFAVGLGLLGVLLAWYRVPLAWSLWALLPLTALLVFLALGVGSGMAALNVRYRDVRYVLPFVLQIWLFASPVIYPASLFPHPYRQFLTLNPLLGIIEAFRAALFGTPCDVPAVAVSAGVTLLVLAVALIGFQWMEKDFADVI